MSIQVKLRGGTSQEHSSFKGVPREVTVNTTVNTLVVHDGVTFGGHPLAKESSLLDLKADIKKDIDNMKESISSSHNHDNKYAKIVHQHDEYVEKVSGTKGILAKNISGYDGLALEDGTDTSYVRTTRNGLIPYQGGGYSNIGTSSWRFANGYFSNVDTNDINAKRFIVGENVKFGNDDHIQYDDNSNEYQFTSDGDVNKSRIKCGHVELSGKRIYVGSSFPYDAREGDILIQV